MRHVIVVEAQSAEFTNVLSTVRKAAATGVGYLKAAYGTFVAGDVDDLDNVWVILVAAYGELYALTEYCPFLVNAASHSRLFSGDQLRGDIHKIIQKLILPSEARDLAENLIFKILNLSIKLSHRQYL